MTFMIMLTNMTKALCIIILVPAVPHIYADDCFLHSNTVSGLQNMMDLAFKYGEMLLYFLYDIYEPLNFVTKNYIDIHTGSNIQSEEEAK